MMRLGRQDATIEAALQQLAVSREVGVEPVLTLGHLAASTDVPLAFLKSIVDRRVDPYRNFSIRKAGGGSREISSPDPDLMQVQRWMLRWTLARSGVHPASYAYEPGRSTLECSRIHCGSR